jgi:hypothetical protein
MKQREGLAKSAVVALIIGLLFPMGWIAFTGSTTRTPVVEKRGIEQMSEQQRQEWIAENPKAVGFVEHISSIPSSIADHWAGYLQAALGIFLVVFVLNRAYLLGGRNGS